MKPQRKLNSSLRALSMTMRSSSGVPMALLGANGEIADEEDCRRQDGKGDSLRVVHGIHQPYKNVANDQVWVEYQIPAIPPQESP
jgi:hypothetical protein